jgi:hypothetical protein
VQKRRDCAINVGDEICRDLLELDVDILLGGVHDDACCDVFGMIDVYSYE